MIAYLRFGWVPLLSGPVTFAGLLYGGLWSWAGLLVPMSIMVLGDALLAEDTSSPQLARPSLLDVFLFGQLPWTVLTLALLGWKLAPGDVFGIGAAVEALTGIDVLAQRQLLLPWSIAGAIGSAGLLISANFFIGHELIHRRSPFAVGIGNWLLATVADTQFTIAHVYQHHKHVATAADPATARRGESLYAFASRSSVGQWIGACNIERARLQALGRPVWCLDNRFVVGQMMTVAVFAVMGLVYGGWALLGYAVCVCYAKFLYEAVNYIQHYGLVRVPNTPVEPRHSWDCTARLSSPFMFNLTRHSDHHARGDAPFWELRTQPAAPTHKQGYFATILLAMVPFLWHRRMAPLLAHWDAHLATNDERKLLRAQADAHGKLLAQT